MTVGFVAIGRPTFDVALAEQQTNAAYAAIETMTDVVGSSQVCMSVDDAVRTAGSVDGEVEAIIVFQATFADSTLVSAIAENHSAPLILWAISEPEVGGRLRLNSFCGINLAGFFLKRVGRDYRWMLRDVDDPALESDFRSALRGPSSVGDREPAGTESKSTIDLSGKVVGVVGTRPDGFEPCDYDADTLAKVTGVRVEARTLDDWFGRSGAIAAENVEALRDTLAMTGIDDMPRESLDASLRLGLGLTDLSSDRNWDAVATRCWPECFTEFGGAACFGNSAMSSAGKPGCCEADVYGCVTALALKEMSADPPFVADLVGFNRAANTATFWHCGNAPQELAADTPPAAALHSNRAKPLLNEFRLKPGRITIVRLSQSANRLRLVVGAGEVVDDPLPFAGTSGVVRLDSDVNRVIDTILSEGLEHHYGIGYGDHVDLALAYAAAIGVEVVEL